MSLPNLSERLLKIAELIPPCNVFLDVGTDHAYLPVYLLKKGICKKAIASDVKDGPLKSAEKTAALYSVSDLTDIRKGSGFETVSPKEADAAVVAGMGGILIKELMLSSFETVKQLKTLILQPMTAVSELREFLYESGWSIKKEYLAKEGFKIYHILDVEFRKSAPLSRVELFMGKDLLESADPLCREYISRQIKKLKAEISGLSKGKNVDLKLLSEKKSLLLDIENYPERNLI